MKKHIIAIAAIAMLASLTACGSSDSSSSSNSVSTTASSTASDATGTSEEASAAASTEAASQQVSSAAAEEKKDELSAQVPSNANSLSDPDIKELEHAGAGSVSVESGGLNLRTTPGTDSDVLVSIPNGTQLDLYKSGVNGWYAVQYDGKTGYVSSEFIKPIGNSDQKPESTPSSDISPIVGTWNESDVLDPRTLTINSDGSFTCAYKGGGAIYGTVQISSHDGSISYIFNDNGGDVWGVMSVTTSDGQEILSDGQLGTLTFVR